MTNMKEQKAVVKRAEQLCKKLRKGGPGNYSKEWIEEWLLHDVKPALENLEGAIAAYKELLNGS